jgi:hypothetical protein
MIHVLVLQRRRRRGRLLFRVQVVLHLVPWKMELILLQLLLLLLLLLVYDRPRPHVRYPVRVQWPEEPLVLVPHDERFGLQWRRVPLHVQCQEVGHGLVLQEEGHVPDQQLVRYFCCLPLQDLMTTT